SDSRSDSGSAAQPEALEPEEDEDRDPERIAPWSGDKPPMPGNVSVQNQEPSELFETAGKSVYVLLAAESRESFKARKGVSQGSAVAISRTHALTNCHVIGKDRRWFILVRKRKGIVASLAHADPASDRCIVRVRRPVLIPVLAIRPDDSLKVGERVYTIGSPRGLENTLGEGLISGLRKWKGVRVVQTTAPISRGSSGGALFDARGNLVGITTFLLRDTQNLNFAIAAEEYWR
ncbi:MAG: trypsin-like peptidase domain-containing protein, partial [Burkholderiales bacterium]